ICDSTGSHNPTISTSGRCFDCPACLCMIPPHPTNATRIFFIAWTPVCVQSLYHPPALAQPPHPRYAVPMTDDRYQGPDQSDADLFDDELDVIDCPHCHAELYAYADKCPHCGTWLAMRHRNVKN